MKIQAFIFQKKLLWLSLCFFTVLSTTVFAANNFTLRMKGINGDERITLSVGGTDVQSWTISTTMSDYTASTALEGEIRVVYSNDIIGRDAQVDYLVVNGETRQAEHQTVNTAVWANGSCGSGTLSELMHCNGYISFGNVSNASSSSSSSSSGIIGSSPLEISTLPLYAGGGAKPNVLFIMDDSGSMRDAVNATRSAVATSQLEDMRPSRFLVDPRSDADDFDNVLLTLNDINEGYSYLSLCPGVNVLAFDPSKTYKPWYGLSDSSFPSVQKTPNQPGYGNINLASARYVEWRDNDNDGEYDFGECGSTGTGTSSGVTFATFDLSRLKPVSGLSSEQKQNFANWYTYHRNREYAVKAGISHIFADLRVRAGISTIHIHNQAGIEWGLNIQDVDDLSNPLLAANKQALIDELYEIIEVNPTNFGGTPLRRTLENAGLYFHLGNSAVGSPETGFLPDLSTSPLLPESEGGACQTNHMVLVTDGYQYEFAGQAPRFSWGNEDSNAASGGGIYSDTLSNTLADIAMYFYDRDASPTLPGKQNVHTHAVSFGVYGTLNGFPQSELEKDWPTDSSTLVTTVMGGEESPHSLDDVVHAAFNGRGSFMTATDADTLTSEMEDLMDYISRTRKGTATSISFDGSGLASSTTLFRTLYAMEDWSGKLYAYNFTSSTSAIGSLKWEAADRLALKNVGNPRKIVTFNGVKGAAFQSPTSINAPNTASGELSSAQLNDLLTNKPDGVDSADYLQDVIEFLRLDGDSYTTSPQFRIRPVMGDVVHSSPVFVGAPEGYYPDSFEASPYRNFASAKANRTPIVYVGANDGMLHAFNANTGDEVFAYIPQGVFSDDAREGMHWLADPYYQHLPYVDETPAVADIYINNAWSTYLVGGLGRGGKSIYVLDITDPGSYLTESAIATNVVVNEFSDTHLGYTYGTPKIGRLADGEWVAVFGNGYDNDADGKAYLYVLYLDGAGPNSETFVKLGPLGGDHGGHVNNGACEYATSDCNGLSAPTIVDLNSDGILDRVYAGDLHGNVWAFDFTKDSNGDAISNGSSVVPVLAHESSGTGIPFFVSCAGNRANTGYCPEGSRQPITTKPAVAAHPSQTNAAYEPNLMVFFGTGRYISEADVTNSDTQTFYGVWDSGEEGGGRGPGDLTAQTLTTDANGNRTISTVNSVNYQVETDDVNLIPNYGWKVNLPSTGERVIENPSVVNNIVLFPTRITSNDLCDRSGTGFIMGLDLSTGAKPAFQIFPDQSADVGVGQLSGGELMRGRGAPLKWFATDPDDDASPTGLTVISEPKRAPKRSSWTILK